MLLLLLLLLLLLMVRTSLQSPEPPKRTWCIVFMVYRSMRSTTTGGQLP